MEKKIEILRRQVKDLKAEIISLKQKQHSSEQGGRSHIVCEQAALDLKEEMKFRESFIQSLPGFFVAINSKGKTVLINDSMLQALGYTKDEVVGKDFLATFVPESEREKVSSVFQELLHNNKATISENHIVAKDGKELLMEWQGRYVLHETGQVDCFYGVGTNITERKRSEEAQRENEAIFNSFLENCPVYVFFKDETTRPIRLSRNYEQLLGRPIEDLLGKTMDELFPSDLAKKMVEDDLSVLRGGQPVKVIEEFNGRIFETTKFPTIMPGKSNFLAGFTIDITERRQAEIKIKESQRLMDYIIRHDPNAIAVYDKNLRYIFVSERYLDDYNVKDRNIIGKHHYEVFPEMPERWKQVHQRVLAGAVERAEEDRFERLDGSVDYNRWECRPWYRLDGSVDGMITYTEVITERRRAEDSLRESEARYRTLIENIPQAVLLKDRESRYISINKAYALAFGLRQEEVIGKSDYDFHPKQLADKFRQEDRLVMETGEGRELEEESVHNGQKRFYDKVKVPVRDSMGKITGVISTLSDITERKKAEEALRDSEERHRKIIEASSDAIILRNYGGIIIYANPAAFKLFRANHPTDLIGKQYLDLVHPDDRAISAERVKKTIEENWITSAREHRILALDGQVVLVESIGGLVKHRGETQIFGVFRDITERKLTEEALRQSEEKFRLAFRTSPDSININRLSDGTYIDINDGFIKLLGYPREEVIGKTSLELNIWVDPKDRERLVAGLKKDGFVENLEAEFSGKDGRIRIGLMSARLLRLNQEEVILSITRDITERKQIEERLRETEKKYRELAESLPQVIFEVDLKGDLIYLNHTGHELFGYTPEDFAKGFNVLEAFIPEDRERVALDIKLNAQDQRFGRQDYTALKKDGTKFPAGVHAGRVMSGQTATGIRGILIDLTETLRFEEEKKKLETQLRQAQKMEAIGSLAGGIAHDFNNILSVIIGNTELLEMSGVSSDAKNGLDQILSASQRAKQLVRQILTFSRQGEQQKMLISLKPVVRETLDFLRASIPSTIQLQHYIKPDSGTIIADSTQMQQVLMNLCTNAAHAMEEGGGVLKIVLDNKTIAEKDVRLDPEIEQGEYVKLTVSDTGHGIEPSVLDRIFDPYFTTKGPDKGTGLGLAVVHGIVKSHGGIIRVYSEVGKGTVFHVLLPRADEAPKKEEKAVRLLPSGTERILVVDDEKPLADIYEKMLGMLGYQVEIRTSPVEALEAVRMNPQKYDLVITDMTMPQMTGYSLSKKLMEIRPGLPVILCTGFSDLVNEEKARSVGILAFLLKPVPLHDLANTMRKVLDETHREKHS
jgi:PAS domain S-box-containing protein